ncbi:hypothetical protein NKH18_42535 [Streptomyces sp. M10(2022)]
MVVVHREVPGDLVVVDTRVHAVEAHQLLPELLHARRRDRGALLRVLQAVGVEQDHAHPLVPGRHQAAAHLVGDQSP